MENKNIISAEAVKTALFYVESVIMLQGSNLSPQGLEALVAAAELLKAAG